MFIKLALLFLAAVVQAQQDQGRKQQAAGVEGLLLELLTLFPDKFYPRSQLVRAVRR
jgi:hypothetical protein